MKKLIILTCLYMLNQAAFAQEFEINLELKPRFEYRHGFKTLIPDDSEPAAFVSQRSRLNLNYKSRKMSAYLSLQNVRVWGDVNTLSESDVNATAFHEAWAMMLLSPKISLKMGRQEIDYDDSRIFGNVDWAQSARSHDALLAIYRPNEKSRLDIGLAMNEEDETLFKIDYDVDNYKSFQYLWYHAGYNHWKMSLLFLNTGFTFDGEEKQKVDYSQTFGTHIVYNKNKLKANASIYFQTGQISNTDVSAFNFSGNIHYDVVPNFNIGIGAEYLSGTDMDSTDGTLKSFNPLFGTNHKFNGWMDYFYVGNHINSVGLCDFTMPLRYQKDKVSVQLIPHVFTSAATVIDIDGIKMDNYLGTEIDMSFGYKIDDSINFQVGYSQMLATKTMEVLKSGNKENTNNWVWAMLVFKPTLFNSSR